MVSNRRVFRKTKMFESVLKNRDRFKTEKICCIMGDLPVLTGTFLANIGFDKNLENFSINRVMTLWS